MNRKIDLILIGPVQGDVVWKLGEVLRARQEPGQLLQTVNSHLNNTTAQALLFWDQTNGDPDAGRIERALNSPGDVWHFGLKMGMSGLPRMMDHVSPTWMLNLDVSPERESTSWRLSLKACLIRVEVIRNLGFIHADFKTLEAAGLEMGHRYITKGAIPRYLPWLVEQTFHQASVNLPLEDEILFIKRRFGSFWTKWALFRALFSNELSIVKFLKARKDAGGIKVVPDPRPLPHRTTKDLGPEIKDAKVTVLIPTLERYPYLHKLLDQLRSQTIKPFEIIVIDQTAIERRDHALEEKFSDLPLNAIYLDSPGQCSSRNTGLQQASGEYILLLDDDIEIEPNLIESHVRSLRSNSADASSGVINEPGGGELPEDFKLFRVSDVFPAGNSLVPRSVLAKSGLFDLAYERGQRADGDLGIRIYQTGGLMVLNPDISILHHRAPRGGLRVHKARVITFASSRQRLTHRHLPSNTEIYLARRYFSPMQVREMLWIRVFGTFVTRGSILRKLAKIVLSLLYFPNTLYRVSRTYREATRMLERFPQFPALGRTVPLGGEVT
jgi:glycosyltransferase involved in cell wall biosynthesis